MLAAEDLWRDLVPRIFRLQIPSETRNISQPASPLNSRWHLLCPLDHGLRADVLVASPVRVCGEASEMEAHLLEKETCRATQRQIGLNRIA